MLKKYIHSLILAGILLTCYAITLAPGLSWANGGADGGDLIAAAATGGIAHPSGYPLYLSVAGIFQLIPFGTLAFRTNLLSATCAILASLALQTFLQRQKIPANIALLAGLAFGLAPAIWSQAVITEVYSLQSLLLVLFLWGLLDENFPGSEWMRGLLFGLAASNHLTTLLLLPLLLLRATPELGLINRANLAKRLVSCVSILLITYFVLWLRAAKHSPINWGNPVTPENLWWLVSGRLYATYPFDISPSDVFLRIRTFGGLLLEQFGVLGVLAGVYGLLAGLPKRMLLTSLWIFAALLCFAVSYGSYDSQVYLIPVYLAFIIWLAHGIEDILRMFPLKLVQLTVTAIVIGLIIRIPFTIPSVDASHDLRAEQFGARFITTTPQNAIIFANDDEPVFALWYFHYALGERPDVIIIAEELLAYPWYTETLAHTYPSLKISRHSTSDIEIKNGNPGRPACYISSANLNDGQLCNTSP